MNIQNVKAAMAKKAAFLTPAEVTRMREQKAQAAGTPIAKPAFPQPAAPRVNANANAVVGSRTEGFNQVNQNSATSLVNQGAAAGSWNAQLGRNARMGIGSVDQSTGQLSPDARYYEMRKLERQRNAERILAPWKPKFVAARPKPEDFANRTFLGTKMPGRAVKWLGAYDKDALAQAQRTWDAANAANNRRWEEMKKRWIEYGELPFTPEGAYQGLPSIDKLSVNGTDGLELLGIDGNTVYKLGGKAYDDKGNLTMQGADILNAKRTLEAAKMFGLTDYSPEMNKLKDLSDLAAAVRRTAGYSNGDIDQDTLATIEQALDGSPLLEKVQRQFDLSPERAKSVLLGYLSETL